MRKASTEVGIKIINVKFKLGTLRGLMPIRMEDYITNSTEIYVSFLNKQQDTTESAT